MSTNIVRKYMKDGFAVPEGEVKRGPYELVAVCNFAEHTEELVIATGHNAVAVRESHTKVSRNADVISAIELRDSSGVLETLWKPDWDFDFGYQKPTFRPPSRGC
jgi:hypothetical protein